MRDTKQAKSG